MTTVMLCGCKHKFQDETYGLGMRCYNKTKVSEGKVYRCSVCGNQKGVNLTGEEAKKLSKKGK